MAGLEAHLAAEREAAKPEFLRQRPKYFYFYEWMKKRIGAQVVVLRDENLHDEHAIRTSYLPLWGFPPNPSPCPAPRYLPPPLLPPLPAVP